MVSQDSPLNTASTMVQQFFIPDCMANHNQFENQNFNVFGSTLRGSNTFPQSLGVLPSIQESQISHTRHLVDLLGAANATNLNHQAQGLSLSLGSQMLAPQVQYRQRAINSHLFGPGYLIPGEDERKDCNPGIEQVNDDYSFTGGNTFASPSTRSSSACYGTESFGVAIKNSRFLKPTQDLLEEIVSVKDKAVEINNVGKLFPGNRRGALGLCSELKAEFCSNGLLSADRHDLQAKIAKLMALLEEVEGRYEKYYHQMEEVVSSFEETAGFGAAKSYTALALQAMSRHFCNLMDAIVSQINATRRIFSQDLPKISTGMSRLSLFDRETGNNRIPLHQLGMIQSQKQAWRPIRGLPETSVTILRSWLFEHFLHPYPSDSEKLMLASQTGLTKNQVSNWFINARVRLWKPMIEEMYKEEFAESSEDSNPMTRESVADHYED